MFQKSIGAAIEYLITQQQENGSFLSLSTTNRLKFKSAKKYHSIFPSSLIFSCLCSLEETKKIKLVKDKLAKFLLSQKSKNWSFNYWIRNSKQAGALPYPDDLDDTFCALTALYQYNPNLIDGSVMAKIITLLTAVEEKEGGPYRTWLVPETAEKVWQDVDLAVNNNVAYFLSLHDVHLPNINFLVEQAIANNKFHSPYYPSIYPVIYFISRWYPPSPKLTNFLLSKRYKDYKWGNPLNTALVVSSLLNFGIQPRRIKKSIDYLNRRQQKGVWEAYPFVTELIQKRKITYAGSSALTTAFCLEAIAKYQSVVNCAPGAKKKKDKIQEKIYKEVIEQAEQRFLALETDLKKLSLAQLKKTVEGDTDRQIVLVPYFFAQAIGKRKNELKHNFLVKTGLANLYGWVAYTIYDDFLDDEGKPKLLSVANVCLRELSAIYSSILPSEAEFTSFFQQTMDKLDAANTWEVTHCRFNFTKLLTKGFESLIIPEYEDYSKLAGRSLGHALGPAAILFSLGYKASSLEVENLMKFFKHYLIARQLNDDAHDWERDLKMGHINAVGAEILKNLKTKKLKDLPAQAGKKSKKDLQFLQEIFWYDVVANVCGETLKHVRKARGYMKKVPVVSDVAMFEKILVPIEESALKALKERKDTLKFIKSYTQT